MLATASTTAAQKLSAAAAAVNKLTGPQLAEGVADLTDSPEDAPDALLSLMTGRVHNDNRVFGVRGSDHFANGIFEAHSWLKGWLVD